MQQRAVSPSQSGNLTIELFAVAGSSSCLMGSYENPHDIVFLSTSLNDISHDTLKDFDDKVKETRNYFDGFVLDCANNYLIKAQSSTDVNLKCLKTRLSKERQVMSTLGRGGSPSTPPMLMNAETELIDAEEAAVKKVKVIMDKFVKLNDASNESLDEVITALREIACYYSSLSGPFWQYIADDIWAEVYAKNPGRETETLKMDALASKYPTLGGEQTESIIRIVLTLLSSSTYNVVLDTYHTFRDGDTLDHELNDANEAAKGFVDGIFDMFLSLARQCKGELFDLLKLFADQYSSAPLNPVYKSIKEGWRLSFADKYPGAFLTFKNAMTELVPVMEASKQKIEQIMNELIDELNNASDRSDEGVMETLRELIDASDGSIEKVIKTLSELNNASDRSDGGVMETLRKLNDAKEASNMEAKDIIDKFTGKLNNASDGSLEEVITDFFCDVVLVKCSSWYESLIDEILRLRYQMILHPLLTLRFKGTFIKNGISEIAEIISILPRCGQHDCGHLHSADWHSQKFCISWKKPSRTGEVSGILSK